MLLGIVIWVLFYGYCYMGVVLWVLYACLFLLFCEFCCLCLVNGYSQLTMEQRRCSSSDSLSMSCQMTPCSLSQGSPGSSNGSRSSSSSGSPPPPLYDSAPHYTDISHMTPRHQNLHAAAAAAAPVVSSTSSVPTHVGGAASSAEQHSAHRIGRRRERQFEEVLPDSTGAYFFLIRKFSNKTIV